jgi:catechol 2,3-dioxygenase-like lactoylglutathione lyase family enzyme
MKIKLTSIYVDDQEKALRFYTDTLGFVKKSDVRNGPYRWLTVASPEEPDGTELQLALNDNPAAKAYQQAIFAQSQPAANFHTGDLQGDYDRMSASVSPSRCPSRRKPGARWRCWPIPAATSSSSRSRPGRPPRATRAGDRPPAPVGPAPSRELVRSKQAPLADARFPRRTPCLQAAQPDSQG